MKRFLSARAALAAVACVSALAAAACASTAPDNGLSGTSWRVQSIDGARIDGATIAFGRDRVSGSGGCNRFFGGYAAEAGAIAFSGVGATRVACAPERMRNEDGFFTALKAAHSYRRDAERVTLFGRDGPMLVLVPLRRA